MKWAAHLSKSIFLVVTMLSAAHAADESTCSTVRLDKDGGPFERLPVYDQNRNAKYDSQLCYAVTASLLIDANRSNAGESIPPFTAPLSVALNYKIQQAHLPPEKKDPGANPLDPSMLATTLVGGGSIETAIDANQNQFVCDQRFLQKFDDAIGSHSKQETVSDSDTNNFLKNIFAQTEKYRRDSQMIEHVSARIDNLNSFFRCRTSNQFADIKNILEAVKAANLVNNPIEKANAFVVKLCSQNSFKVETPEPQKLEGFDGNFLLEYMALITKLGNTGLTGEQKKQLVREHEQKFDVRKKMDRLDAQINNLLGSKNPIPVGIGYCHGVLSTTNVNEKECIAAHASVIVGRQFNSETQQCEFLVRDSYGPGCKDETGKPKYAWPCENGTIRIPSDRLLRNAASITWIPQN